MKRIARIVLLAAIGLPMFSPAPALACTNFLVTRGATVDGSTMITYSADAHDFYGEMYFKPPGEHAPGAKVDVYDWESGKLLGQIDQIPRTYGYVGNINERQVAIGETTWGGREELIDPEGGIDYGSLMYLTLQRAGTAREAIGVMTELVARYGYYSSGESFSISDPQEVWILELIGKGPGNTGAVWVARKVPDGYISGHANAARIRTFPLDSPDTTLYAPDVISFARERGYFDGLDKDFSFADAYNPDSYGARRFCDARVWCMYRRAAPSNAMTENWVAGDSEAEPLPLWIKPDRKLKVADVIGFMRDHFEGTPLDMTDDVGAGPYRLPYRWRPLTWESEDVEYFNERAVSTQQTAFSFVSQSRSWLPDPIGGVLWFGVDDTYSTVYFPAYSGIRGAPHAFAVGTGSFTEVTWDAAFWVFNYVSNFAYLRYADMIGDIQVVQAELESRFMAEQAEVDAAALALHEQAPRLAADYLTEYSHRTGNGVVERWRELGKFLLYRYLDGNVKNELGEVTHPGYPETWYRQVAGATGERLQMRKMPAEKAEEAKASREAAGVAAALLTLLDARGIPVSVEQRARIEGMDEPATLKGWLVAAATAESTADAIGSAADDE